MLQSAASEAWAAFSTNEQLLGLAHEPPRVVCT